MKRELGVLNVGAGDTKLSFDKSNPVERERAKKIVEDMIRRGYAILIEVGQKNGEPLYQRAKGFDPETCEYIISGGPDDEIAVAEKEAATPGRGPWRPRGSTRRVPAEGTRGVAVGRTAGG